MYPSLENIFTPDPHTLILPPPSLILTNRIAGEEECRPIRELVADGTDKGAANRRLGTAPLTASGQNLWDAKFSNYFFVNTIVSL